MGASGTTVLDLGSFPGVSDAEFTLTGLTGIADASKVEAWIQPADTTAGWSADGLPFNGSALLLRGANLTGAVASATGIMSIWFMMRDATTQTLFGNDLGGALNGKFRVFNNAGIYEIDGFGATGIDLLFQKTVTKFSWVHMLADWDIVSNVGSYWIDDTLITTTIGRTASETIGYNLAANWGVGVDGGSVSPSNAVIAEVFFAPGQRLDFTVDANRRKFNQFVAGQLKPVSLGTTGSLPTGTAPLVYTHLDNGEAAQNFKLNRGTGGNFAWSNVANVPSFGIPLLSCASHSTDEHEMDSPEVKAYSPSTAGASMKVRLFSRRNPIFRDVDYPNIFGGQIASPSNAPLICGKWNIGWAWA